MGTQIDKPNFINYKPIVVILGVAVVVLVAVKIYNKNKK